MAEDKTKARNDEVADDEEFDEDEEFFITLEYDNGIIEETKVIGYFELEDKEYIALEPQNDTGDYYIFGYIEDESVKDGFKLIDIKDDEEFDKAVRYFEKILDKLEEED